MDAYEKGVTFSCVIFDAWYLTTSVVELIKQLNKFWIAPLKSNRIVLKQKSRIPLKEYVATIPKSSFIKKKSKVAAAGSILKW